MVNRIWPTVVAGKADCSVSASACHIDISGQNSVNHGQIFSLPMQVGGVAPGRMVYIYMDYISLLEERRQVCFDRVEAVDLDVSNYSFLRDVFTQRAPKDTVHLLEGRLLGVEVPVIWLLASCNVHTAHLWHPVHVDLKADYCHGLPKATKNVKIQGIL